MASRSDIYPALYYQHIIDELALMAEHSPGELLLAGDTGSDADLTAAVLVGSSNEGHRTVTGFSEPGCDLLARQVELVLRQLRV